MKSLKLKGSQLVDFDKYGKKKRAESLEVLDIVIGSGDVVSDNSKITAHYTGALCATGVVFQSSLDSSKPLTFELSEVIQGWREGLIGMRVGGERRLIIPAALAYGRKRASGAIPADSDLVFDIQLISVAK